MVEWLAEKRRECYGEGGALDNAARPICVPRRLYQEQNRSIAGHALQRFKRSDKNEAKQKGGLKPPLLFKKLLD
jgi:hypothetical protein